MWKPLQQVFRCYCHLWPHIECNIFIWSGCSTCQQRYRALQVEVIAATPNTAEAQTALQVKPAVRSTAGAAQIDLYDLSRRHDMSRRRIKEAEFRNEGDMSGYVHEVSLTLPVPDPACSQRTLLTTSSIRRDRLELLKGQ